MSSPLVSIICPVYNAERYLDETVRSVLAQTYSHWELLLMMDAKSSDSSLERAQAWSRQDARILVKESPQHLGVANNRNHGIALACGDYVAFLDAGDLWQPEKLFKQIQFMQEQGSSFSCHAYRQIDPDSQPLPVLRECPPLITYEDLLKSNVIGCLTVMLKTDLLKKFRFAVDQPHEDFILWLEILKTIPCAHGFNENLARYRVLPHSRSGNKKRAALERWSIYRQVLGLNLPRSLYYFCFYAVNAILQRRRTSL
jgi:teichuronic acid biosynthesis glycosyltransferase TuaG